jgi:hypothetical protein
MKVDVPFFENTVRGDLLKQQNVFDTIWLPVTVSYFSEDMLNAYYHYEYHKDGQLKKLRILSPITGDLCASYDYNNHYRDPMTDIIDTIFFEEAIHPFTGEYIRPYRFYYNHHQADSSYFEEYYQVWDDNMWKTGQRTYVHLMDTATVSEFQHHIEVFNQHGQLIEGGKIFLTFNENGTVSEALVVLYDVKVSQYEISYKYVYLYDEEGKCHTRDYYVLKSAGVWKLESKLTNIRGLLKIPL